jgi:hypothetical protein
MTPTELDHFRIVLRWQATCFEIAGIDVVRAGIIAGAIESQREKGISLTKRWFRKTVKRALEDSFDGIESVH